MEYFQNILLGGVSGNLERPVRALQRYKVAFRRLRAPVVVHLGLL